MEHTQSWTASSHDLVSHENVELEALAENWSTQLQVLVTRPAQLVQGPIETRLERRGTPVIDENE